MIKSYIFEAIDERMYIIYEDDCDTAVVIDPNRSKEALKELESFKNVIILLTHHHFDHICGVNAIREITNCEVICTRLCASVICSDKNGSRMFPFLFLNDKETFKYIRSTFEFPYTCTADTTFEVEMHIDAAGHSFDLIEMSGHSPTCMMIMMDNQYLFAGDNVLGNGNELVFNDADKDSFYEKVIPYLESLQDSDVQVMPGHGEPGSIKHFLNLIQNQQG